MNRRVHVIVGAGQAGGRAAEAMRLAGFDGKIVLIGDEAEPPYQRPPLSKDVLTHATAETKLPVHRADYYRQHDIECRPGTPVTAIDRTRHLVLLPGNEALPYDRLLLATGSRPRPLLGIQGDGSTIHYLRTIGHARALRTKLKRGNHLIMIGGGIIGLEVAATATDAGCKVTIVEASDRLIGRAVAPSVSAFYHDLHASRGVRIFYGLSVADVVRDADAVHVEIADRLAIEGDAAVVAIGVLPNIELAEQCGILCHNGIRVDSCGRTSDERVFAAGEVASYHNRLLRQWRREESWLHADRHGAHIGRAMCIETEPYDALPWFWSDQFDANLQVSGRSSAPTEIVREHRPGQRLVLFHLENGIVVGATTINDVSTMRQAKKLVECRAAPDPALLASSASDLRRLAAACTRSVDDK